MDNLDKGLKTGRCSALNAELHHLYDAALRHDPQTIKRILKKIVPEYAPYETKCVLD